MKQNPKSTIYPNAECIGHLSDTKRDSPIQKLCYKALLKYTQRKQNRKHKQFQRASLHVHTNIQVYIATHPLCFLSLVSPHAKWSCNTADRYYFELFLVCSVPYFTVSSGGVFVFVIPRSDTLCFNFRVVSVCRQQAQRSIAALAKTCVWVSMWGHYV